MCPLVSKHMAHPSYKYAFQNARGETCTAESSVERQRAGVGRHSWVQDGESVKPGEWDHWRPPPPIPIPPGLKAQNRALSTSKIAISASRSPIEQAGALLG